MPFCEVAKHHTSLDGASSSSSIGTKIFYKTYGHGPTKVLLIIGNGNHKKESFLFSFELGFFMDELWIV